MRAGAIDVLQMNLGKLCNQTCQHCHVDAGPSRPEVMTRETMEHCLRVVDQARISCVDLTGGAPEMNPQFEWLVRELRRRGCRVIDRCNLTILSVGRFQSLPVFLAEQGVEIVASLPHFSAGLTDSQRGRGVFETSIAVLRRLNELGYGQPGTGLSLNLVYNPAGAFLAPKQSSIEPEYRRELIEKYDVVFNALYVLANLPISRFLAYLERTGQLEAYMQRLVQAFNPAAVAGLMCRNTLSVAWNGRLHDCDFNQMLDIPLAPGEPAHISEFERLTRVGRPIMTANHCYGCTAGQGSSCGGAIVRE